MIPPTICIIDGAHPITIEHNGLAIRECPSCGLMWRQSFDVDLAHYEDADANFDATKERLQRRNIADRIGLLRRYVDFNGACDIGGSKGYFIEGLMTAGFKGAYGIDPNKAQVEAAQRRGTPMYEGSSKDAAKFFRDHTTKTATLFHVIEHLPDPTSMVEEMYAALPQGGHLVIETPDFSSYIFKATKYRHKLVYSEHLFYFSLANLQELLKKKGFSIVYAGKRDFDQYHLGAQESLSRLGFVKKGEMPNIFMLIIIKFCELFLRVPLSWLVKASGRQNFSLVVGRKA
jgi:2-polyprenyl-3-methyl-5-hydroxy-6-metoxy-1,4-benzoquinol methylase